MLRGRFVWYLISLEKQNQRISFRTLQVVKSNRKKLKKPAQNLPTKPKRTIKSFKLRHFFFCKVFLNIFFTFYHGEIVELNNYELNSDKQKFSSNWSKLIGLVSFLEYSKPINRKCRHPLLYWETNSQVSFYYLTHGSRETLIQNFILQVKLMEIQLGITVVPLWTSRAHFRIRLANNVSRLLTNTDKWGVPKFCYFLFSHIFLNLLILMHLLINNPLFVNIIFLNI